MAGKKIVKCDDEIEFSVCSFEGIWGEYESIRFLSFKEKNEGESYNGSMPVSKTVHGGSNPSSPALDIAIRGVFFVLYDEIPASFPIKKYSIYLKVILKCFTAW